MPTEKNITKVLTSNDTELKFKKICKHQYQNTNIYNFSKFNRLSVAHFKISY